MSKTRTSGGALRTVNHSQTYVKLHPIKSSLGSWTESEVGRELCINCKMTSAPKTHTHTHSSARRLRPLIVCNYSFENVRLQIMRRYCWKIVSPQRVCVSSLLNPVPLLEHKNTLSVSREGSCVWRSDIFVTLRCFLLGPAPCLVRGNWRRAGRLPPVTSLPQLNLQPSQKTVRF